MTKKIKTLLIAGMVIVLGGVAYLGYERFTVNQSKIKMQEYIEPLFHLTDITHLEYKDNDRITLKHQGERWINP